MAGEPILIEIHGWEANATRVDQEYAAAAFLRLIEIKKNTRVRIHNGAAPGTARIGLGPKSNTMHKFALKLLLTRLSVRRGSTRINGAQLAASLLTLVGIVLVGLYVWSHGQY